MDVFQLLDPTILLCRLFELTPVVLHLCESSNSKEYTLSRLWLVYAMAITCAQTVLQIACIAPLL